MAYNATTSEAGGSRFPIQVHTRSCYTKTYREDLSVRCVSSELRALRLVESGDMLKARLGTAERCLVEVEEALKLRLGAGEAGAAVEASAPAAGKCRAGTGEGRDGEARARGNAISEPNSSSDASSPELSPDNLPPPAS